MTCSIKYLEIEHTSKANLNRSGHFVVLKEIEKLMTEIVRKHFHNGVGYSIYPDSELSLYASISLTINEIERPTLSAKFRKWIPES
ncbi:hypothetical protein BpHYR1_050184 [Brachionus plicatilis]|uniref:Uncharacterized protein n=1 Tax=Brachionus plicatilis TaxID=10195 RepID=A0A3M7S0M0_BRAPC|nr:hypothetical protein BpHYR1_050184 [Brachionus plicatilis]